MKNIIEKLDAIVANFLIDLNEISHSESYIIT